MTKVAAPAMREVELHEAIRALCKLLGLDLFHPYDSRRSTVGFPDLVIVGDGGVLFRETKTHKGRLTAQQSRVLARLQLAGQDADVWRPDDLISGRISRELQAIRRAGHPARYVSTEAYC